MALYLTNIATMQTMRHLNNNQRSLSTVFARLSSGFRINSAKDDAAGLQIANRMTSQINGLIQGSRNTQDAQAVVQLAEGALDESVNMLQRIRTLAIQSINGTNSDKDREALNQEVYQLSQEINRIAKTTKYNNMFVFNGDGKGDLLGGTNKIFSVQVGANSGDSIDVDLSGGFMLEDMKKANNITTTDGFAQDDNKETIFDISTVKNAEAVLANIDGFLSYTNAKRTYLGAMANRFDSVVSLNATMNINMQDARARIQDTDFIEESANLAKLLVQQNVASKILRRGFDMKRLALSLLQ